MKSTRAFLESPFKPVGTNQQRHKNLEELLGKHVEVPEHFLDQISEEIMDNPCNIKLTPNANDYYIDLTVHNKLKKHPYNSDKAVPPANIDKKLAGRIHVTLMIEEMILYVHRIEAIRQAALSTQLSGKSATDISALLAFRSEDILKHYHCKDLVVPQPLLSMLSHSIMTLPVKLDGNVVVDFFELLVTQPARKESQEETHEKEKDLAELKRAALLRATADYERNLYHISINIHHNDKVDTNKDPIVDNEKLAKIPELIALEMQCYENRTAKIMEMTLEDFNECRRHKYLHEFLHPFTDKPLESLEIDFERLAALDDFLNKARTHQLLKPIYQAMAEYNAMIALAETKYAHCTNMEILEKEAFPNDRIPDNLLVAIEPGSSFTIIPTHPVILDESYTTDFLALLQYWQRTTWGLNPTTNEPINTIKYDRELKDSASYFVLNNHLFRTDAPSTPEKLTIIRGSTPACGAFSHGRFARMFDKSCQRRQEKNKKESTETDKDAATATL